MTTKPEVKRYCDNPECGGELFVNRLDDTKWVHGNTDSVWGKTCYGNARPKPLEPANESPKSRVWTQEERETAAIEICISGKDAGIDFFGRNPKIGFAIAVDLLCELNDLKKKRRVMENKRLVEPAAPLGGEREDACPNCKGTGRAAPWLGSNGLIDCKLCKWIMAKHKCKTCKQPIKFVRGYWRDGTDFKDYVCPQTGEKAHDPIEVPMEDQIEEARIRIHDLESNCDPAGNIQQIASMQEQIGGLLNKLKEVQPQPTPEVSVAPSEGYEVLGLDVELKHLAQKVNALEEERDALRAELATGNRLYAKLTDKVNDLQNELATLQQGETAWVKVSERMPDAGEEVEVLARTTTWQGSINAEWSYITPHSWRPYVAPVPTEEGGEHAKSHD